MDMQNPRENRGDEHDSHVRCTSVNSEKYATNPIVIQKDVALQVITNHRTDLNLFQNIKIGTDRVLVVNLLACFCADFISFLSHDGTPSLPQED